MSKNDETGLNTARLDMRAKYGETKYEGSKYGETESNMAKPN